MLKIKLKLILIIVAIAIVMLVSVSLFHSFDNNIDNNSEFLLQFEELNNNPLPSNENEAESNKPIMIDVKGAVNKPGVYEMLEGDRVYLAIEKAEGFHEQANVDVINLAALLSDEMVIFVPFIGQEHNHEMLHFSENDGEGKINLNTASLEQLQTIPGIGPAKASAIVQYREEFGPFKEINELTNVSGIGIKTVESIRDSILVR